jgi:hypothetical protein
MTRITKHYGIDLPVEFLDIHVHKDNRLFVDPKAIREQPKSDKYARSANRQTTTFFNEVARCVLSSNPSDNLHGEALLQHFNEPSETRLGMSTIGWKGHGAADELGTEIWNQLNALPQMFWNVAVFKFIEDIPVFVDGIDKDITSDLTSRIIYSTLADFTQDMMATHPEFTALPHLTDTANYLAWDPVSLSWGQRTATLPVAEGSPLMLVPRDWVRRSLLMSTGKYLDRPILDYVQLETATTDSKGRVSKRSKDLLRKRKELSRGLPTVVRQTVRALNADQTNLMEIFRQMLASEYQPYDEDLLDRFIG